MTPDSTWAAWIVLGLALTPWLICALLLGSIFRALRKSWERDRDCQ